MYYIGWDIGIKNLAYCIIEKTNTCEIIHGLNIINLINIEYFLTKITYDPNLDHLIYDNISTPEFQNIRLKILNQYKQQSRIIGFITKQHEYIFENKLKICYHDSENTLEKKILILNYDLIIVNNPTNLITTKNLLNNLLSNFK